MFSNNVRAFENSRYKISYVSRDEKRVVLKSKNKKRNGNSLFYAFFYNIH